MEQKYIIKVDEKYWLCGYLDKGAFYKGHYIEVMPHLVENKSEATHYDYFEIETIKKIYGEKHKLKFEEVFTL